MANKDLLAATWRGVAEGRLQAAQEWVGTAKPGAKYINPPVEVALPESTGVGSASNGVPVTTKLVTVHGVELERAAGYDFYLMALAAAEDGVLVKPAGVTDSGFRTYEQQKKMYAKYLAGGAPAANPDKVGNHQRGLAVDIDTGLGIADYTKGVGPKKTSVVFNWLSKNAGFFGFNHTEGNNIGEPWHWVHKGDGKIYGLNAVSMVRLTKITPSELGSYADNPSLGSLETWAYHGGKVILAAGVRADKARVASREDLLRLAVTNSLQVRKKSLDAAALATRQLDAKDRRVFSFKPTAANNMYDYETGTWGDGQKT